MLRRFSCLVQVLEKYFGEYYIPEIGFGVRFPSKQSHLTHGIIVFSWDENIILMKRQITLIATRDGSEPSQLVS